VRRDTDPSRPQPGEPSHASEDRPRPVPVPLRAARAREQPGRRRAADRHARAAARRGRVGTVARGVGGAAQTRGGPLRRAAGQTRPHADQSRNALHESGRSRRGQVPGGDRGGRQPARLRRKRLLLRAVRGRVERARGIRENVPRPPAERLRLPGAGIRHELAQRRRRDGRGLAQPHDRRQNDLPVPQRPARDRRRHVRLPIDRPRSELHAARDRRRRRRARRDLQTRRRARRDGPDVRRQPVPGAHAAAAPRPARVGHARHLPRRPAQLPGDAGRRRVPAGRHLGSDHAHDRLQTRRRRADEHGRRHRRGRMVENDRAETRHGVQRRRQRRIRRSARKKRPAARSVQVERRHVRLDQPHLRPPEPRLLDAAVHTGRDRRQRHVGQRSGTPASS
jgi:hypothetical protein